MFFSLKRLARRRRRIFRCVQVEVTSRCFLRCVMCPLTALADRWVPLDMEELVLERLVEDADLASMVYLSGWGEPLLRPDLPELVRRLRNAGTATGFTTNGVLFGERRAGELLEAGLDLVSFSIAGATRETHAAVRVGSDLARIAANIRALLALRRRLRTDEPKVVLLYLMLRQNVAELPAAVELAHELGADELVATNITYAPTLEQDQMRVFSCPLTREKGGEGRRSSYAAFLREAEQLAGELGVSFRAYPLDMEEAAVCDEDPLHNTFITADGQVGPCVYLNMMLEGPIPRCFCGEEHEVARLTFGSLRERGLAEIWESEPYAAFRRAFSRRLKELQGFLLLKRPSPEEPYRLLERCPLPPGCTTCYKAYGL